MSYRRSSFKHHPSLLDTLPIVKRTIDEVQASRKKVDKNTEFVELVDGFENTQDRYLDNPWFCTFFIYWWSENFHLGPRWCGQIFFANPDQHIRRIQERGLKVVLLNPNPYSRATTAAQLLSR